MTTNLEENYSVELWTNFQNMFYKGTLSEEDFDDMFWTEAIVTEDNTQLFIWFRDQIICDTNLSDMLSDIETYSDPTTIEHWSNLHIQPISGWKLTPEEAKSELHWFKTEGKLQPYNKDDFFGRNSNAYYESMETELNKYNALSESEKTHKKDELIHSLYKEKKLLEYLVSKVPKTY